MTRNSQLQVRLPKPTPSRAFSRVQSQSASRALCVPQRTVLRASSDPRPLCWKRQPRQSLLRRLGTLEHPCPWHSPRLRELRSSHHPCGSPSIIEPALLVDSRTSSQSCDFSVAPRLQMSTCTSPRLRSSHHCPRPTAKQFPRPCGMSSFCSRQQWFRDLTSNSVSHL